MPDTAGDDVTDTDILAFAEQVQLQNVRVQNIAAVTSREGIPDDMRIRLNTDNPTFLIDDGRFLVRFVHHMDYLDPALAEDADPVAKLKVAHIVDLTLDGDPPTSEVVSEFIHDNLVPLVYPYLRVAFQRLATDLDLPPVTLPFLRVQGALPAAD